jgi:hypothetical protein
MARMTFEEAKLILMEAVGQKSRDGGEEKDELTDVTMDEGGKREGEKYCPFHNFSEVQINFKDWPENDAAEYVLDFRKNGKMFVCMSPDRSILKLGRDHYSAEDVEKVYQDLLDGKKFTIMRISFNYGSWSGSSPKV